MYKRLFKYLTEIGLRNPHSAKHAIIELVGKPLFQFHRQIITQYKKINVFPIPKKYSER